MKKELKYLILLPLLTLVGCSNEEDVVSGIVSPQTGETLQLTVSAADFVTDGAPDTRATDNGNKTNFEKGDRVGIIILDAGNNLIYDNIPYEYNNGNWTFDSNNDEGKGGCYYDTKAKTYIVYYPYSRAADGVTSVDDLKVKFSPRFVQSDITDYRASDLMVWSSKICLTSTVTTLNAELKHAFASLSLTPTAYRLDDGNGTKCNIKVSDVSLTIDNTVYVPFQATDGSLRCIVPADITSSGIRCFYTFSGTTYGNTINISVPVVANTRYTSAPEIIDKTYTLADAKVGDFYCKNSDNKGYLIPSEVALTDEQKKACIGIVCSTNINRIGNEAKKVLNDKGVTTPHGLVMALTNASDGCHWGYYGRDENGNGGIGTFQNNTDNLQKQYNNVDGYAETHWMLKTYNNDTFAFYHANRYGTTDGGTPQYAAPTNTTTGWFIPSMGQWWDILSNLGEINLTDYRDSEEPYKYIPNAAPTAVNNMNQHIGKINGATKFSTGTDFWSSSEYDSYEACRVGFRSYGNLDLDGTHKGYLFYCLRCVLAF